MRGMGIRGYDIFPNSWFSKMNFFWINNEDVAINIMPGFTFC